MISVLQEVNITSGESVVLFVLVGLSIGLVIKWVFRHYSISVPYTIAILVVGILLGLIQLTPGNDYSFSESIIASFNPILLLVLFLPALIFDSAYNIHFYVITQTFVSAVLLAGPGVIISTVLTGVVSKFAFSYDWSWYAAFMFGAIISATDPVAVVALLRDVGAPEKLSTIVEAEALLNDGSGFVLYLIFSDLLTHTVTTTGDAIAVFVQLALGGIAFGLVFGYVTVKLLNNVFNDSDVEIGATIIAAYFCFYIAQVYLNISAVLATVVMGLCVSKYRNCISPDVQDSMHNVWTMIAFLLNTLIFVIAGVIVAEQFINLSITAVDVGYMFLTYLIIHVARIVAVCAFLPLMRRSGVEVTWQEAVIITWSGLRGAVALVLALLTTLDASISTTVSSKIVFLVAGNVLLTTVINGSTTKALIAYLEIQKPTIGSEFVLQQTIDAMRKRSNEKITLLKSIQRFGTVDWEYVDKNLPDGIMSTDVMQRRTEQCNPITRSQTTVNQYSQQVRGEVSRRLINAMLSDYYKQYSVGMITRDSLNILLESSEKAADSNSLKIQWDYIAAHFRVPFYWSYLYEKQWLRRCGPLYRYINKQIYQHLCVTVELITSYLTAVKHTKSIVNVFPEFDAIDKQLVESVQLEALKYQKKAFKSWLDLQQSYDSVYSAVQTRHATQSILYFQRKEILNLLDTAILDNGEYSIIRDEIDSKIYWLERESFEGRLIPSDILLQQQYWIQELPTDVRNELIASAYKKFIQYNQPLLSPSLKTGGMFIIVRGTVTVKYIDDFTDSTDEDHNMMEYNDIHRTLRLRTLTDGVVQYERKEKLSAGSILGAHDSMTTGITFQAKANTYVEAYFIDRKAVLRLCEHDNVPSTLFLIMAEQLLKSRFFSYLSQYDINYLHVRSLVESAKYVQCSDTHIELQAGQRLLLITGQCQLHRDHTVPLHNNIKSSSLKSTQHKHKSPADKQAISPLPAIKGTVIQKPAIPTHVTQHLDGVIDADTFDEQTEAHTAEVDHSEIHGDDETTPHDTKQHNNNIVSQIGTKNTEKKNKNRKRRDTIDEAPVTQIDQHGTIEYAIATKQNKKSMDRQTSQHQSPNSGNATTVTDTTDDMDYMTLGHTVHNYNLRVAPVLLQCDEGTATYDMISLCRYIVWDTKFEQTIQSEPIPKHTSVYEEATKYGYNVASWSIPNNVPNDTEILSSPNNKKKIQYEDKLHSSEDTVSGIFDHTVHNNHLQQQNQQTITDVFNTHNTPSTPNTPFRRTNNLQNMFIPPTVDELNDTHEQSDINIAIDLTDAVDHSSTPKSK